MNGVLCVIMHFISDSSFATFLLSKVKKLQNKSKKLFYTLMLRVPLNTNIILWVAPSDQQSQLQKFPEGRDLWQPTATSWWRWDLYPGKFA